MISINSVQISTPSDYQVYLKNKSKAETNANGNTIIEIISTKRELVFSYNYLSQSALATLLQAISGTTFTVAYPDPQTGAERTGTFYSGDRTCRTIDYQSGVMRYKDIKFNLIEV